MYVICILDLPNFDVCELYLIPGQLSCMLFLSFTWPTFMYMSCVLYLANIHVCELYLIPGKL